MCHVYHDKCPLVALSLPTWTWQKLFPEQKLQVGEDGSNSLDSGTFFSSRPWAEAWCPPMLTPLDPPKSQPPLPPWMEVTFSQGPLVSEGQSQMSLL